jgi:hypothetical protein
MPDGSLGKISAIADPPNRKPPLVINSFGFQDSQTLSSDASQFTSLLDEFVGYLTDVVAAQQAALSQLSTNTNLSPAGRIAERQNLAAKLAAEIQKRADSLTAGLKDQMGRIQRTISLIPTPPKDGDVVANLLAVEIRTVFRNSAAEMRFTRAMAAAKAADARVVAALFSDPADSEGRVLSREQMSQVTTAWSRAAFAPEYAQVAGIEETIGMISYDLKTALNLLQ